MLEAWERNGRSAALRAVASRLWTSAVVWSFMFNLLRLASVLLLLPLLLHSLSKTDLGYHYFLLDLVAFGPLLDLGLLLSIDRAVSLAMGGATELRAMGVATAGQANAKPNHMLVWRLLHATRRLYRYLALALLTILAGVGTWVVRGRIHETSLEPIAWLAWGITAFGAVFEMYAGWWTIFIRAMNYVLLSWRIATAGYALKLVLACILLLSGAGLLAFPIAGVMASLLTRWVARRMCLRLLAPYPAPAPDQIDVSGLLRILWPNSWRAGLQFLSTYAGSRANGVICATHFGLAANSVYGLSMQITSMIQDMSLVWVSVKWPMVGQLRARHDNPGLQRLLRPRFLLFFATFFVLAAGAAGFGQDFLRWIESDKQIFPRIWLALLLVHAFFEIHANAWATVLATGNRIPSLWPMVVTNAATIGVVTLLILFTDLGLGCFIVGPLITWSLFNHWYWGPAGARNIGTTWLQLMFGRQNRKGMQS